MSSMSGLFIVRVVLRSCVQGQGYLEVMSTISGLFGHQVYKFRIV